MNASGIVTASIPGGAAVSQSYGFPNTASTSTDNMVQFNLSTMTNVVTLGDTDWTYYDDQSDTVIPNHDFVFGPMTAPLGLGSARFAGGPPSGPGSLKVLFTTQYAGTRFDEVTTLSYQTYGDSGAVDPQNIPTLQFNVDFDLDNTTNAWQGRVVYTPYLPSNGTVVNNTWQTWDVNSGYFWYSQTAPSGTQCSIAAPCTKAQMLADHPNMGIHNAAGPTPGDYGFLLFRVQPQSNSNVDNLVVGVNSANKVFDFEPGTTTTTVTCPGATQTYTGSPIEPCTYQVTGTEFTTLSGPVPMGNYTNNINVGLASAFFTYPGDDNHSGSTDNKTFSIGQAMSTTMITCGPAIYDGTPQTPCMYTVTGPGLNIGPLPVPGGNYTNNVNAGINTASATFSYPGDMNHTGSMDTVNFTIDKAPTTTVVTCPASVPYTGMAQTPCSALVTGPGGLNQMLTVNYMNNTAVGTATADASYAGDSNYLPSMDTKMFLITSGTVTGHIDYYLPRFSLPTAVKNLKDVDINGVPTTMLQPSTSAMTDPSGNYTMTNFGTGSYNLTASKTTQVCGTSNGITANDAAKVSQYVVGLIGLTPEQVEAAKVAQFLNLSSFDAALISQKVVALCTMANHAGEWKFYTTPMPFANPLLIPDGQMVYSGKDYRAYMLGDVDGDWNPAGANRPFTAAAGDKNAVWASLPAISADPGSEITVPLRLDNMTARNAVSYQFDIEYDATVLSAAQAAASIEGTMGESLSIAFNATQPGLIKVAVYGALPVTGDGVYANLRFKVIGAGGSVSPLNLSNFMFDDNTTPVASTGGQVTVGRSGDNVIRGRVLNQAGRPLSGMTVVLADSQGAVRTVVSDRTGRFEAASLTSGEVYTISVRGRLYSFLPVTVSMAQSLVEVDIIATKIRPPVNNRARTLKHWGGGLVLRPFFLVRTREIRGK